MNILSWDGLIQVYLSIQEKFNILVALKERMLKAFFAWPWVEPIFRYISPNDLCYLRIFGAIFILYLSMNKDFEWLFAIFCSTVILDFIDGPLARSTNRETLEGKKLDPIADKVLISIPLLVIGRDVFDTQTFLMFILVEGLLLVTAIFLKPYLQGKEIPLADGSNVFGQIKMFVQTFGVGFLLYDPISTTMVAISETIIWIGIFLGIASFLRHLARMKEPTKEEKENFEKLSDDEKKEEKEKSKKKRIITAPNLITLLAIFMILPAGIALMRHQYAVATIMIVWIFGSDWLDGYLARKHNQVTYFGTVLDPIRDNIARFGLAMWLFYKIDNQIILSLIVTVVVLEFIIGLVCTYHASRDDTVTIVTWWGKLRGAAHYILLIVPYLHSIEIYSLSDTWLIVAFSTMILFSFSALISYLRKL